MQPTQTSRASPAPDDGATSFRQQYLSFQLGGLDYGIDFAKVQELRPLQSLDRFAAEGAILNGVAVSRGVIMPLVDMRIAFISEPAAARPTTDVIILKLSTCVMGMVVDGVTDIVTLDSREIAPMPGSGDSAGQVAQADYLLGIGLINGRRLILIDIDKLMSIKNVAEGAQQAA